MALWMFKTEPDDFSFDDLEADGTADWDGVKNAQALIYLRQVAAGDEIFIYHTGTQKSVVGVARATGPSCPDTRDKTGKMVIVPIMPVRRLSSPVSIAAIRGDRDLAQFPLIRNTRLSVMPVMPDEWQAVLRLAASRIPSPQAPGKPNGRPPKK